NYLALGHYHTQYELDGWVFNPGSIEMMSLNEYDLAKGFYHVRDNGAKLITPITRPVRRIKLDMSDSSTLDDLYSKVKAKIEREPTIQSDKAPLIELVLYGEMNFPKSDVNLERIRDMLVEQFKPLWSEVKLQRTNSPYAIKEGDVRGLTREQIELRVFSDRIKLDGRYRDNVDDVVKVMTEVKKMAAANIEASSVLKELRWSFAKIKSVASENDTRTDKTVNPQQTLLSRMGE
ncbi:MAG: hypothetical protein Q7U60_12840, partial [Candidatus Methanoperedens sp.]|nr:hypothetical protein [Candidatus Methanoperedens sp.]